jgi:cytoplasmic tRNA 2-thiolation protein 2
MSKSNPNLATTELLVVDISPRNESVGNLNHLRDALSALPKGTGREALVRQLRARLLLSMARTEGCDVLIFGDSMTRQAIRALTLTAEGRGFVMPEETAGVRAYGDGKELGVSEFAPQPGKSMSKVLFITICIDRITETLVFLRPLRDLLSKEIGVYNWFKGLDTSLVLRPTMVSRHPIKGSIERLTEG